MRSVSLLGSTGSIGTQALDIIRRNTDRFRVVALAAGGGQPDVLANVRASRRIRGSTWLRILRHPDHPTSAGWPA